MGKDTCSGLVLPGGLGEGPEPQILLDSPSGDLTFIYEYQDETNFSVFEIELS